MSIPTTLYTYNEFHLGDNIFGCIMFSQITKHLEANDIYIRHYCLPEYIHQISEFIFTNHISIHPLHELPREMNPLNIWIGASEHPYNWWNAQPVEYYNRFLLKYYNQILDKMNIPIQMTCFMFDQPQLLDREIHVNNYTYNAFRDMDFLIINGQPMSGQVDYDQYEWDDIIRRFSEKYNIVTTQKIEGIRCTRDYHLTAMDIASIAKNAKKIIAIDSGVSIGLYNKYVFENVEVVYYLGKYAASRCDFPNFEYRTHIRDLLCLL